MPLIVSNHHAKNQKFLITSFWENGQHPYFWHLIPLYLWIKIFFTDRANSLFHFIVDSIQQGLQGNEHSTVPLGSLLVPYQRAFPSQKRPLWTSFSPASSSQSTRWSRIESLTWRSWLCRKLRWVFRCFPTCCPSIEELLEKIFDEVNPLK